jgi:hypothetical protein
MKFLSGTGLSVPVTIAQEALHVTLIMPSASRGGGSNACRFFKSRQFSDNSGM